MTALNDPQIWTIIGVFAAALFGMLTFMSQSFMRALTAQLGGLREHIDGVERTLRAELSHTNTRLDALTEVTNTRLDALTEVTNTRFESLGTEMTLRFERLESRVEGLDRDVQAITKKVFGD